MKEFVYIGNFDYKSGFASVNRAINACVLLSKTVKDAVFYICSFNYNGELDDDKFCKENKIYFINFVNNSKFQKYFGGKEYIDFLRKLKFLEGILLFDCPFVLSLKIKLKFKEKMFIGDITEWFDNKGYRGFNKILKCFDTFFRMHVANYLYDFNFVVSKYLFNFYSKKIKCFYLPPLMDFVVYQMDEQNYVKEEHLGINYCYFGSTSKGKDEIEEIIKMFLKSNVSQSKLFLVGKYNSFIKDKYSNVSNIVFWDYVAHDKIINLYKKMDYLICLRKQTRSNNAGFPSKIAECITLKTKVICNDFSDLKLYLTDESYGYILDNNTVVLPSNKYNLISSTPFLSTNFLEDFEKFWSML